MTTSAESLAEELESVRAVDAVARIVGLDHQLAKEVVGLLPHAQREAIAEEVRAIIECRDERALDVRARAIWLLRNTDAAVAPRSMNALFGLAAREDEPDDLRCLALDTGEHLCLAGVISADEFRSHIESLEFGGRSPTRTKQRWLRILRELNIDWAVRALKRSYLADPDEDVLEALSRSEARGVRDALAGLADVATDAREASRIAQALARYHVRNAARRLNTDSSTLSTEEFDALVNLNEFALLYKALDQGRVNHELEGQLRRISVPSGISRSQRRFYHMIQRRFAKE